jgi:integrase
MSKSAGGGDGAESNHKRVQEVSSAIEADFIQNEHKKTSFDNTTSSEAAYSQNEHELSSFAKTTVNDSRIDENHAQKSDYQSTAASNIFQVDEGHRSPQTAYKYRLDFRRFLDDIKIYDLQVLLDLGKEAIQELVIKYTRSLRDDPVKKYSRGTVNAHISALFYFFDNNEVELNKRKIRRYYPSDESVNDDRPYSSKEVQGLLSVSDLRTKAMILLMASTGVRIGSLHSMRIGDLGKIEYQGSRLYKVQVYARTRDKYYTFTTPEAAKAIDEYLDYRVRCGEVLKDESPLFRKGFNKADQFTINVPKFLSMGGVTRSFDELIKRSGVKSSQVMRSHAFRKGFKSICEQSGMKSINVELLLGHDIGVSGHYYRPNEADLLEDYMSHAADALTIDPNNRLRARVQQLESQQSQEIVQLKGAQDELERRMFLVMSEMRKFKTRHREWKAENRQLEHKKSIQTEGLEG